MLLFVIVYSAVTLPRKETKNGLTIIIILITAVIYNTTLSQISRPRRLQPDMTAPVSVKCDGLEPQMQAAVKSS